MREDFLYLSCVVFGLVELFITCVVVLPECVVVCFGFVDEKMQVMLFASLLLS